MRKKIKKSFDELIAENRIDIQNDEFMMNEIEDRVEMKFKERK